MDKVQLGQSHLYVSPLALGCMSLGTNEQQAERIIKEATDLGINYLDTADLYDKGINEEIVGKAIQPIRDDIVLATKVGNHLRPDGSWFWDASKAYIKEQVKESLRRLHTDYIDLYQLHGGTIDDPIDDTIEAFEELVQEGYIRYYGISSIRPNVIREYVNRSNIISIMSQYSLFDRRPEEEVLSLLDKQNISVVTRGSLAKGLLSDHYQDVLNRKGQDGYLTYNHNDLKQTIERLTDILDEGQTLAGLAFQYVLHANAVTSIVNGASSIQQLKENVAAFEQSFDQDQIERAREITQPNYYQNHR
ncbi:D-threo-aldose 1-dehydrogenase [Gracilibacillus halophilus YIM-C55.5]|uniref:D-threo-aldose 1-dehydrogenase n=1 Tax=Gracilibacillus halophilus YIM-C55.5 TaxID=1308866 RepID=N4WDS0_9BACI|nr:aldo/keto reductase [Gracilibacillus halophilus]ENH97399.1 D-threo-aldose 1-dehydrogenase [Gracilibacillus halophilus YIM-C55.5]